MLSLSISKKEEDNMVQYLVPSAVMGMLAVYTIAVYRFGYNFGRLERTVEVFAEDMKERLDKTEKL